MSDFDAILFDFDGVLADTEPVHFACWVEALAPLGVPFEWDFFRDHCVGIDDRSMVQLLAARSSPPRDWEGLWACHAGKSALFRRRTLASPPFAPELGGFLKGLHGAYKLAVVTASSRPEIEPLLAAGGLGAYFDALVCGKEAGRHKPAPDPYLHAASLLQAKKPLVVEDSAAGVASGRAAGFEVLAVESAAGMPEAVLRRLSFVDNPEKSAPG
jgi:HAD superfamily hydrolase (TIGR01509 family)